MLKGNNVWDPEEQADVCTLVLVQVQQQERQRVSVDLWQLRDQLIQDGSSAVFMGQF